MTGPAVIHFHLPVTLNRTHALIVFRSAIHALNGAVQRMPRKHTHVITIIDEAQNGLNSSMVAFYQGVGKFGVSIWTIHQNAQDMKNADKNLLPMVMNNATIAIYLGGRDSVSREELEIMCGKVKGTKQTINAKGEIIVSDTIEGRLTEDDINLVNNVKELAIVRINGRAGYAAFNHAFICQLAGFSCSYEKYQEYLDTPWPKLTNAVTKDDFKKPEPTPATSKQKPKEPGENVARVAAAVAAMAAQHPGVRP